MSTVEMNSSPGLKFLTRGCHIIKGIWKYFKRKSKSLKCWVVESQGILPCWMCELWLPQTSQVLWSSSSKKPCRARWGYQGSLPSTPPIYPPSWASKKPLHLVRKNKKGSPREARWLNLMSFTGRARPHWEGAVFSERVVDGVLLIWPIQYDESRRFLVPLRSFKSCILPSP